jgi:hypothetical protein
VIQALEVATAPCFGRSASFMDDSATVQNEQRVYVTRSDGGTWLFVPDPNVPTAKPETQSAKRRGWHFCRPFAFGGEWAIPPQPSLLLLDSKLQDALRFFVRSERRHRKFPRTAC